jgi:hypothetical protein
VSGVFVVLHSFQLSVLQELSLQDTERRFNALVSPAREKMCLATRAVLKDMVDVEFSEFLR